MAKQLNVNLAFTADTSAAKRQIQDLQTQLTNISKMPANADISLTKNIKEASNAAIELKQHLQNATNINTGALDFSKLNQSIAASGTTLSAYGRKLQSIGPEGQKAFMALASSVSQAEIPIRRSNKLLTDMATTLKNTARWQISSSMLHGFMGTVQSAYRYSQDLNESLNNIRIVTGKSSEEMALFAERANQAARSLSATTTDFTNASLIYYQQGLDGAEVEKRAAITIKMANAAGQSAQIVSDQLTAIWNNFYDGSKSLEYYADVMTALGAATASSTDEIAGGLEKFAAIADTIGLSYEYAASALATITSNTRQSEDVVGTALKTIFARIQGLNLGETLEDGTTLNKYSEALDKIGISIYDQSGELKKMDFILDELGNKWKNLNKDQQVALAQTVAGVRQYNQLISLMDNWDNGDSDSMMANLDTAYSSSGTLQEQADIYAESWEAARDRVTAAAEKIYSSLLDENFFIGVLNVLEDFLSMIGNIIDSVGGLEGVLTTLGVVATKVFSEQIATGLRNMAYNLQMSTAAGREHIKKQKAADLEAMGNDLALGMGGEGSEVGSAMREQYSEQIKLQAEFSVRQEEMNEHEIAHIKEIMDMRKALGDQVIAATEKEVAAKDKLYDMEVQAIAEMGRIADRDSNGILSEDTLQDFDSLKGRLKGVEIATVNLKVAQDKYNQTLATGSGSGKAFKNLESAIRSAGKQLNMTDKEIDAILAGIGTDSKKAAEEVDKLMKLLAGKSGHLQGRMSSEFGVSSNTAKNIANGYRDIARAAREKSAAEAQADKVQEMAMKRMKSAKGVIHDWATGITAAASSALSFVSILNSAKGAFDALTNPDLSGWEKFTSVLSSLAMIIMMTVSVMESLGKAIKGLQKAQIKKTLTTMASAAAEWLDAEATKQNAKSKLQKAGATNKSTKETNEDTAANIAHAASEKLDTNATKGNIKSKGELSQAFKDLGKSALNWVKAHGSIIGGVALIAAGVAVAVGAIAWGVNQYNKYENAAKEAAEQANKTAEAYQKVAEAHQEFSSNLSAYEEAQDGMEGLTKGTIEYKEAVLKANEAAMKLLNTYEDLTYAVDSDGLITINEDSLDLIRQQQLEQLTNAQQSNMLANQNTSNKRLEADKKQFQRKSMKSNSDIEVGIGNSLAATGAGAGSGALIGAGIGSIVPGIGTAIGAGVGAIIGAIAGLTTGIISSIAAGSGTNSEDAVLAKLEKLYAKEGNAKFASDKAFEEMLRNDLKLDDENLIKSLVENRESTLELVEEMAANTAQVKAMNEQAVRAEYGEVIDEAVKKAGGDENFSKEVTEAMGAGLEKQTEELYNDKYKDQLFGMTDAEIQKAYAEAMGWNVNKIDNHGGNKATYYDDKGNIVAAELDDEVARRFLAQQAALEKMGVNIDQYITTVQSLLSAGNKLGEGIGTAISSFAGGDGGNLGTLSVSQFKSATENGVLSSFNEGSQSFTYNGIEFNDEEAKKLGYENAREFYDAFIDEIERVQNAWDTIDLDIIKEFGLDPKVIGDLSLETAQAIQSNIEDIKLGPLGEAGGQAYIQGLNKMIADLDTEDQQKALQKLTSIDWSDWDALEQADKIMKEFGVDIDTTSEEWKQFAYQMRIAAGATPDYSKLKLDLNEITRILNNLDFGKVISEEDYQRLVDYNDEWERFFLLQADGSRVFVGDAAQMQAATRENIRQQREELAERKRIQQGFKDAGWGREENGVKISADWENKSGSDTGTAKNLMNATGATEEALHVLGYTDQIIQDMITKATSGQEDLVAEGEAQLREMYQRISEFQKEEMDKMDADFAEMIASTATSMNQLNEMLSSEEITTEAWEKQAAYLETTAARNAATLQELDSVISDFNLNNLDESYTQNLVRIAEGYESCADELQDYNAALAAFTLDKSNKELKQQLALAEDNLRAMIRLEEGAKQYDLEVKSLSAQSKRLAKAYGLSAEEAANLAIKNQRMNKGVSSLVDNWKDWKKQLNSSNKLTQDYADAIVDCTSTIADLVGASENLELPDEFFNTKNMALIEKAMQGDVNAINQLGAEVAATTVEALEFNDAFAELINELDTWDGEVIDISLNDEQFAADKELVLQGINDIKNGIITADQAMSDDWVAALNRMALATGMSVEEMNGLLGSLGVQAQVDTTYVEQPMTVPTYRDEITSINYRRLPVTKIDPTTGVQYQGWDVVPEYTKASVPGEPLETTGFAAVAQISTVDNPLTAKVTSSKATTGAPAASYSGRRGSVAPSATKGSGSGGGGRSTPKAPDKADKKDITKKSEIVERYREVEDAIDNVTDALTKAERASDRLWGKDKLNSMREENKILKQQYNLLQEKAEQAKKYAEEDYAALMEAAGKAGINLSINKETGDITNIEDAMESLYGRLSSAEQEYNRRVEEYNKRVNAAGANPSQAEVDTLEAMKKSLEVYEKDVIGGIEDDIDAVKDAESSFKDSVEIWEESGLEMEEILDQIMQNNYEVIMQGLEIPLSLNEEDLRLVDLKLSQIEDNIYQMAEALVLSSGKIEEYKDNLHLTDKALAELNRAHEAGEITDAAYQEGLQEIKDSYYDNVEALIELDNLMKDYYGNTLDAANQELSKYTEQIEHQTSVLEYYNSLIDLMGKSNDYKMIGKVLEGQVKTTKNAAEISKNWYESRKADAEALEQQYQNALASGASAEELEILKNNWQAAEKAANEAQKQMLSDAEAWAEALKAVLENKLSELGQVLENALTGEWGSFDAMTTSMERANSLQEEYLTATNQIYETNKLMRTAQQAIDKTTNSIAKKKLAAYVEETKQMQDQSKLSSYELEIQQAKYDLLLAEIALEEAQDAKSTVRLQRDSEGNFGYVYTADSNKINEAQQQLEDAQNKLYNIGLEGANSYAEKYQQTMAEMYDTLNQIQQDYLTGSFESEEEYQTAMQTAKDYYYQKLKDYSSLYSVALTTDSRVVADAWSTDFSSMIYDTEIWMIAVNDYTDGAIGAFRDWQNAVTGSGGVTEIIGNSLEEVSNNVDNVTAESQELADITNNEVIPALDAEIESVESLTGAYAAMRDTIADTIRYYEQLISDINNSQNNEWNNGSNDEDENNNGNNGGNNPNGNNPNRNNNEDNGDGGIPGGSGEGPNSNVASYKTGTLTWIGDGSARIWTDSKGKTYSANSAEGRAIQNAFNRAYSKNGGYKGDYFLGWNTLDADVLHKKYGLATGGYTGDWSGSYGKLAFLHQKELVLNAEDTRNFLESMNVLDKIISAIDLYSANSQLGGILSSPSLGKMSTDNLEQQVYIEASFPGIQNRNEIEEAFNNLINQASQYANRK